MKNSDIEEVDALLDVVARLRGDVLDAELHFGQWQERMFSAKQDLKVAEANLLHRLDVIAEERR